MTLGQVYTQKNNNFDFLRFFFASLVFYVHSYAIYTGKAPFDFSGEFIFILSKSQIDGGELAVNMFFLISGFLITMSWIKNPDTFGYFLKRIFRIFPGLIGLFIFVLFIIGPIISPNTSDYISSLSVNLILKDLVQMNISKETANFIFDNLPLQAINGSLWTLKYEFYAYILVAVLGISKILNVKVIASSLVFFFVVYMGQNMGILELTRAVQIPRLMTYFMLGALFFLLRDKILLNKSISLIMIVILVCSIWLNIAEVGMVFAISYLVFVFAYSPHIKLNNFSRYGDLSYGMYIYAFPIQQSILSLFRYIGFELYMLITFLITIFFAYISWRLIEEPSLHFAHSKRHWNIWNFFGGRK